MRSNENIGNPVSIGQLLEFEVASPNEKPLTVKEYLRGGSRDFILNVAALFLGFKSCNSKFTNTLDFLRMFFSVENNSFAQDIYNSDNQTSHTMMPIYHDEPKDWKDLQVRVAKIFSDMGFKTEVEKAI